MFCRKSASLSFSMLKAELMGPHIQLWCFFTDFPKLYLCFSSESEAV